MTNNAFDAASEVYVEARSFLEQSGFRGGRNCRSLAADCISPLSAAFLRGRVTIDFDLLEFSLDSLVVLEFDRAC